MITRQSSLADVAIALGDALRRHGIRAVLTGGACASLHTAGDYQSRDVDFVLVGPTTQARLDAAMASVRFLRRGDSYVHPRTAFYVEFPRGPLAIGSDHAIRPVERRRRGARALILSATDSCRDRLAAFYHWNDRSSLAVAVAIARKRRVDLRAIRRWSLAEGSPGGFEAFLAELRRPPRPVRRHRHAAPGEPEPLTARAQRSRL
ncbi:MAG: hypothetical protein HYV93_15810 [Candidatus Rokubacteria bacterium]|nr:hypothetical protein [Candidatus Rokubacteria bacterium]